MDRLLEVVRLHRKGASRRETVRLLRIGPNTLREYRRALGAAGLLDGPEDTLPELEALKAAIDEHAPSKPHGRQASSVERWRARIGELVEKGLTPQAVYDRLRLEEKDFTGSRSAVRRMCRRLVADLGVKPEDVAIPVETAPGEVAQVDFGYLGKLYDPERGVLRKAWLFLMVLGHSRHMAARIVFDQTVETWVRVHMECFADLGGVPETIVPDNLKAAVIRAAFRVDEPSELNRSYRELARYYDFKIDPTPPRAPKKKGKVESGVKYVKRNFFAGREGSDVVEVERELQRWIREIAGMRDHGRMHWRPLEVFEAVERGALEPLPVRPFEVIRWKEAKVHPDSHVLFDRRLYSVPWKLVGKRVWVRADPKRVAIYHADEPVAMHERYGRLNRSTIDTHLPAYRVDLRHRSRAFWEERADRIGPDTGRHIREVFDADDVLSQLRTVQCIVTHLEGFPVERAEAACRRASHFGNRSYGAIKKILTQALDLEPLPPTTAPASPFKPPRFARSAEDFGHLMKEMR
jgi:transposase